MRNLSRLPDQYGGPQGVREVAKTRRLPLLDEPGARLRVGTPRGLLVIMMTMTMMTRMMMMMMMMSTMIVIIIIISLLLWL